jgi:hypothetical protein
MILRVGKGKAGPLIPFYACRLLRITGKPYLIRLGKVCRQHSRNRRNCCNVLQSL